MLYNLIIAPIETIIDWVFSFITIKLPFLGIAGAIFGVSMAINFLALPIYNIADSLQEKERKIQKNLEARVKRIKQAFKGDEQFMMLQTYYKQNGYHPLYALRSSISILIEIPFFIAAYHYLSHCDALKGISFSFLKDLGAPDHLFNLTFGTYIFYINILPILMTLINIISGAVYAKDAPVREKVQIYVLAALFLVLLYDSPSGLVFYWILNNLFSLFKNVVLKMKHPKKILHVIISFICIGFSTLYIYKHPESYWWKKAVILFITVAVTLLPLELKFIRNLFKTKKQSHQFTPMEDKQGFIILLFTGLALASLCGLVLTSSIIATSPIEFSNLGKISSPLYYIWNSFFVFAGLFVFWPLIIYKMFGSNVKKILPPLWIALLCSSIINTYILKPDYGRLTAFLILENSAVIHTPLLFTVISLLCFIVVFVLCYGIPNLKFKNVISTIMISVFLAEILLCSGKIQYISSTYSEYQKNITAEKEKFIGDRLQPFFNLSKTEPNVIVLFLDRAISSFFPKIMENFPELQNSYTGFTYYPNTLSFGDGTKTGGPAMMGGYEYTPVNMNKRSDELLVKKHNEATLVLPKLFIDAGFEATVADPPWPNYKWKADLSAFKDFPEINVTELAGKYTYIYAIDKGIEINKNSDKICFHNIKTFTLLETLCPAFRFSFYHIAINTKLFSNLFLEDISTLYYLLQITKLNSQKGTYTFIGNETAHNFISLARPEYDREWLQPPVEFSDNATKYFDVNISALKMFSHYLDFLKENGCYDNSRIIIVGDHAKNAPNDKFDDFRDDNNFLIGKYNPLLLVKDFNETGHYKVDTNLMTNADTLFFAIKGLPVSNINPFTKKEFTTEKENGIDIFLYDEDNTDSTSFTFEIINKGVHINEGDISKKANWTFYN